uniref:Uncharacterized protein n=1 Tax=Plectus sambesii TaxID=2011161 RepID=A0A914VJI6_9BILA
MAPPVNPDNGGSTDDDETMAGTLRAHAIVQCALGQLREVKTHISGKRVMLYKRCPFQARSQRIARRVRYRATRTRRHLTDIYNNGSTFDGMHRDHFGLGLRAQRGDREYRNPADRRTQPADLRGRSASQ